MEYANTTGISEDTERLLLAKKLKPRYKKTEGKYKLKPIVVNTDFDLLQNQYPVRMFIQAKFGLSLRELELLLFLYPKQFFCLKDYKSFPLTFTHRKISTVVKRGFVKIAKKGKNMDHHVYTLTKSAKHQVIVYYKYLSGELLVPTNAENNPMIRKDAPQHHKKVIDFFKRMRDEQKKG
jgi:hypothetical protein